MLSRVFRIVIAFTSTLPVYAEVLSASSQRCDVVISVPAQVLTLAAQSGPTITFGISTSKFGVGDGPGSYCTPLGRFAIDRKIGGDLAPGTVLKHLRPTGEILRPNAFGRDPIVTRILCLRGLERRNANAYRRGIWIHGTTEEKRIGRPASYGCIRMRSCDMIALFRQVTVGTHVLITDLHAMNASATGTAVEMADNWFR